MAIVQHVVERTESEGDNDLRDYVRMCVLAIDDAVDTDDAAIQARAVTVLNAQGQDLPEGYFNANRQVTTTWDAAGDVSAWGKEGRKLVEAIA